MKTDTIFYSLFQEFPRLFFELINSSPDEATDYEFTSTEIKQLAFRIDGLFLPKTPDPEKPFYLAEVQFQPDPDLYYRIFGELFLYLRQYQPCHPWRVVVIYPSRRIERECPSSFQELLVPHRVQRIYLDELGQAADRSLAVKLVRLVIEPEETVGEQAQELITQAREQPIDTTVQQNLIDLIETIIVYKLPQKSREEIAAMLNLSELKQTRFYQEVKQEGLEEGREEGLEQGLEQGKQEAKLEAIGRLLPLGLSVEQIAGALDVSLEVVQQIADRLQRRSNIPPEQNIGTFIELLMQQRSLFTAEQLLAIAQLIEPLADEVSILSDAIFTWIENYPSLQEAQSTLLNASALNGVEEERSNAGNLYNKRSLKNAIFQTGN